MKVSLQIVTPTLGDVVFEVVEEKTTTNADDQRAILVELLYNIFGKAQMCYEIPKEMLDLGEYSPAQERYLEEQKKSKPSSAEKNRSSTPGLTEKASLPQEPENDSHFEGDEVFEITEEEQDLALAFIETYRLIRNSQIEEE